MNELIIVTSVFFIFAAALLFFKLFGFNGLAAFTVLATLLANIEVLILVKAFGIEQTLGNVLFSSSFLLSDIASEIYGKERAQKIVKIGILANIFFVLITQSWLLYTPSSNDHMFENIRKVFSSTPRLIVAALTVYAISQLLDVWVYHKIWSKTTAKTGDPKAMLWLRNNGSTLISQFVNAVLFTFMAFYGVYDFPVLIDILLSSYMIFIALAFLDTVFIYIARDLIYKKSLKSISE